MSCFVCYIQVNWFFQIKIPFGYNNSNAFERIIEQNIAVVNDLQNKLSKSLNSVHT